MQQRSVLSFPYSSFSLLMIHYRRHTKIRPLLRGLACFADVVERQTEGVLQVLIVPVRIVRIMCPLDRHREVLRTGPVQSIEHLIEILHGLSFTLTLVLHLTIQGTQQVVPDPLLAVVVGTCPVLPERLARTKAVGILVQVADDVFVEGVGCLHFFHSSLTMYFIMTSSGNKRNQKRSRLLVRGRTRATGWVVASAESERGAEATGGNRCLFLGHVPGSTLLIVTRWLWQPYTTWSVLTLRDAR